MTIETINGLHKCQPKNEPQVGQVKTFQVIHNPARNGKKAWIKIKSAPEDKGGIPYKIVSVEPTGWEPDDYGNLAFNIEIEPAVGGGGGENTQKPVQAASSPSQKMTNKEIDETYQRIGPARPMSKDEYWQRKLEHEIAREPHITRMHSQSMALEVLKLKVALNELTVEDLTPAKLRSLADYFDADCFGTTQ